jgi:glucose-6-phosphate 1-dehydrogenase
MLMMTASRSDALVLFGVTGDLAHKMIFPRSMQW